MTKIRPRLDTLPPAQRALWPMLNEIGREFVLYGGTALSLQVGGRQSVDFDFFTSQPVDSDVLARRYSFLRDAAILQRAPATATFEARIRDERVKISFFGTLDFGRVSEPVCFTDNGIHAAGLLDIAVQKVKVVQQRSEAKDYIDVHTLLSAGISLESALGGAITLYPGFNSYIALKALGYFKDGDLAELPLTIQQDLVLAVSRVREIPTIPKKHVSILPDIEGIRPAVGTSMGPDL